ncbi:MAG TPA: ABC transporter permease [Thermoanaerobaculia bacterium]|nr:ABC transporter permease [Thermoanaerobaculia bacterium]
MAEFVQDLRQAWRMMTRNRGLAAVIVATLALGIGATTSIFSVVDRLILRPLPFREAERLVFAAETAPEGDRMSVAWPNFVDWRARARSFDRMEGSRRVQFNLTGFEAAEQLGGRMVTGGFFDLLGVQPQVGRLIVPNDDRKGEPDRVVVSDRVWRRLLNADPRAVGRNLILDGKPYAVIGVLPAGFQYTRAEDLFLPMTPYIDDNDLERGNHSGIFALARLKPGVTLAAAKAEMKVLTAALAKEHPESNSGVGADVHPLAEVMVEDVRTSLLVLMVGVGCVLLLACVNLASLLLARATARQGEIATRLALGAGRARIARQMLTESLVLAVLGGALGIWLAKLALPLLVSVLPATIPRLGTVRMDGRVLLFAAGSAIATAFLFGLLPALQAARTRLHQGARSGRTAARFGGKSPLRRALLIGEIALAVILLTASGLMMRTIARLGRVDPGFRPEHVLSLSFSLVGDRYDEAHRQLAYREIVSRIEALPGVEAAGLTLSLPFDGSNWGSIFIVEGQPVPPRADLPTAAWIPVSPGLFPGLGLRMIRGRSFSAIDTPDSTKVIVVNETMAKRLWPGKNPIGQRVKQGWPESETPWREVVGVVADVKLEGVDQETPLQAYLPLAHNAVQDLYLVVRTAGDPALATSAVVAAMHGFDRDVPVHDVRTMAQVFEGSIGTRRFPALFLGQFSLAALILAALGIFGLMSYAVAQRTHEVGVRIALGARDRDVVREMLGESLLVIVGGTALGLFGALAATRLLRSLLFEVQPTDPATFAGAIAILGVVALLAAYIPARRAAGIDPVEALRAE